MTAKLTKHEQETIINFNRAEGKADIFTYEKRWQRHMEENLGIRPIYDNGFGGRGYKLPKHFIRLPSPPRRLSVEARAKLVLRAKHMNMKKNQVLVKNPQ